MGALTASREERSAHRERWRGTLAAQIAALHLEGDIAPAPDRRCNGWWSPARLSEVLANPGGHDGWSGVLKSEVEEGAQAGPRPRGRKPNRGVAECGATAARRPVSPLLMNSEETYLVLPLVSAPATLAGRCTQAAATVRASRSQWAA
jgi:hypothetical protein